jgi:hypothetical protein
LAGGEPELARHRAPWRGGTLPEPGKIEAG